jgi:hypothetical protein
MNKRRGLPLLAILVLAILLAGCGQNVPGVGAIQARACEPLTNLNTAVGQFAAVSEDVTVGDVKQIKVEVDSVIGLLRTANQALNSVAIEEMLTAYDDLAATVEGLPDDQPLGDAAVEIQAAVQQVQEALDQAISALSCAE